MFVQYNNLDIRIALEEKQFRILNIARETLHRIIPSHNHGSGSLEIHYTMEGCGKVLVDGMLHELEVGTVYVVGSGVRHAQIPDFEEGQVDCCIYLQEISTSGFRTTGLGERLLSKHFWIGKDRQEMHSIINRIFWELDGQCPGYTVQVQSLLTQLAVCVLRNYDISPEVISHFVPAKPSEALSFIIEEAFLYEYSKLTLASLAGKLGLSARQTQRFLLEHYGKSFREMRREARMSAATILLTHTDCDQGKIAEELGYSTAEHFAVSFKQTFGMSPGTYRKQNAGMQTTHNAILMPPIGLKSADVSTQRSQAEIE